ncbi:hypothetical protein ACF0H5_004373 [Mactra antiquata]
MSGYGRKLKRIEEDDEMYLKYAVPFPLHVAAAEGDTEALPFLTQRKHVNSCNEQGQTPLHVACKHGHTDAVIELLKLGADFSALDRHSGRTPLHYACSNSNIDIVKYLLKNGAVPYDQDKHGVYPMHVAAHSDLPEVIKCLVTAGGQVNGVDTISETPLHYAAKINCPDTIKTLVECGGNVESKNKNGETPLHIATIYGCVLNIKMLQQLGADLNSRDKNEETPLHRAVRVKKTDSIDTLAKLGADLYARNDIKECPLHLAARLGYWKEAQHLLKASTDIEVPYKKGSQAIHIAAQYGSCDVIHLLKKYKVNLNAEDKVGNRPLHFAVKAEHSEAIRVLVDLGAEINAGGKRGDTSVHQATKDKKTRMVQVLGSVGADCNTVNDAALCPLFYSAVNEDLQTSKALIHGGANVNMINSEGEGLVHIMVEEERLEALTMMKNIKANFNLLDKNGQTCVHQASRRNQTEVLRHLRDIGVDLNMANKFGLSSLHVAVLDNKGEEVDMLNSFGLELNCPSKNFKRDDDMPSLSKTPWPPQDIELEDFWKIRIGMTPVHLAFCMNSSDILHHLVSCGADINAVNNAGESVFHIAVLYKKLDWLQPLITLGANRNCTDKYGRTPLHYAAHAGDLDGIRLLLKYGAMVSETDFDERQPLHYAAEGGHFLLLRELTGNNLVADINCKDKNGCTPLHFACKMGHIETILELNTLKADVKVLDMADNTILHMAGAGGQHEVIALLAAQGHNMDIQNKDLKTPLHVAAEHGHSETMEYLLMCGADPTMRDKQGNTPTTYRLSLEGRQIVGKRIKLFNQSRSLKHTAGEINYDCKMLSVDNKVTLKRLGINVTLIAANNDIRPIIFLHRTPADSKNIDISLSALEEILSDVYELRVLCLNEECTLTIDIPLEGYPGNFDSYLKTTKNERYPQFTTSEQNGVPTFVGKVPIGRETCIKFAVVARPAIHNHEIGTDGGTLISDIDRKIRTEIPKNVLNEDTSVSIQVIETGNIEKSSSDRLFAANIVNVICDTNPSKQCQVQIPLHDVNKGVDNVIVFQVNNEEDLDNERKWLLVDTPIRLLNDCMIFNIKAFGIYIPVNISDHTSLVIDNARHGAKERIKSVLLRETSALFFYALCPKKDSFLTILECTTPGRFHRRREFWENEGFCFHSQVQHSGHFPAKPNQEFFFDVTGNIQFAGPRSRGLRLAFNPRAYKYQSFYLTLVNKKEPAVGEIQVYTNTFNDETKKGTREIMVTGLPVDLPIQKSCIIS